MKLYMGVTPDKFELPIAVFETGKELAERFGVSSSVIYCEISRQKKGGRYQNDGRKRGVRFIGVEIEDYDPEEGLPKETNETEEVITDPAWDFDGNAWRFN